MAERLDIEDFFREIEPDLCQYAYTFCKSGFTSSITMKCWQEQDFSVFQYISPKDIKDWFLTWSQNSIHAKAKLQSIALLCQRKSMKLQERWVSIPRDISATFTGNPRENAHLYLLMVNINFWAWKFALHYAKLQMFDDQSSHVWLPIRACFGVTCSRLDASDGSTNIVMS